MKRYLLQLMVLVMTLGVPGVLVTETASAAPASKTEQANDFCRSYPNAPTSTKVSETQCKKAFVGGYTEGGVSKSALCKPSSLRGAKLTSCNKSYDKGAESGRNDRAANPSAGGCTGKGVKVSKALGTGGCIGGGDQNPIFALVAYGVQFLTGIFGVILVLVLVIAGLQYVISGDDPEIAKEAKERIKGAITGLVLFVIMFGLIQMILPPDVKLFTSS